MSFLFPSILWGLFATIIPLIIHLASKRTSKTVEFPSLIHLKSLETESIKKLKTVFCFIEYNFFLAKIQLSMNRLDP